MRSWFLIVAMLVVWPALADVVHLQDGTKIEGTIQREPGGWALTDKAGKLTHVSDDRVQSIEKTGNANPGADAEAKLNVLRRSVESVTDIGQIVDRYSKFIDQNKNSPAATAAGKELEVWKDRQAKGLVKVGGAWVTAAEQAEVLGKTAAVFEEARALVKDGHYKDADVVLSKLLATDPNAAPGVYLKGVVQFKLDQLGQAKKTFERVKELAADHGPTLNNLAVIAWQQKQVPYALSLYDQAMLASPRNRRILDNVAEALGALDNSQRASAMGKRVLKRFLDQDVELGKQLEQEGLKRWFGQYLNKEQQAEVKKLQAKVDLLAEDYQKTKNRVMEIEQQIDANERAMRQMQSDSAIVDSTTGQIIRTQLPRMYYELKRQNDGLKSERLRTIDSLDAFKEREAAIYRESPIKPFTGVHRIMEAEGTPLMPAKVGGGPATQPSTRPAKN